MSPLLIIGDGAWGSALALVAASKQVPVRAYGKDKAHIDAICRDRENKRSLPGIPLPENISFTTDLAKACEGVEDVLVVVPSQAVVDVAKQLQTHLKDQPFTFTIASKGIEAFTGRLLYEAAQTILGAKVSVGVLSGPSFAREVAQGLPTAVSYASRSTECCQRIVARLATKYFRIYVSDDPVGVSLGGVLKNILAIAAGISDGLQLGSNARAALITRGLAEMCRFGTTFGAKHTTMMGLSGVGDLVLTATDDQSRNRRFGLLIGQGVNPEQAIHEVGLVEGWYNVQHVWELAKKYNLDLPITEQVYLILHHGKECKEAVSELLARDLKKET